ncbi:hypothetical protein DS909_10660 [Phaeobacter gallaeciensis]|uniref:Excalibur calcium-binding domain-containing protein n=2 Tax=Roseobacteraceae TaxID=2854170 RepID=A0A366X2L5_9RHOB|nr:MULTISPECIES: hypothetical protein [Roseobacteraceae]MBT3143490.1 hypothetical protein [Falsiruegeria litorea]MBT8167760.1 hypothetical protein [Falsiruegeria litorea]RBW55561.1 hypothetical protein DS909_10660 [Phaeobacter gallaeciensis]
MRAYYLIPVVGVLTACSPAIPDSAAGVGFNSPQEQAAREAALAGETVAGDPLIPPSAVASETLPDSQPLTATGTQTAAVESTTLFGGSTTTSAPLVSAASPAATAGSSDDIALEAAAALAASNQNSGVAPLEASPSNPAPSLINNPGISDENDFAAVSSRQSIESDAERIARNKEQYQVVTPTAVPERSGTAQPNIVSYALETTHPVGTSVYTRTGFNLRAKSERNCRAYASADQAQQAFLDSGGPRKDRKALDPDGDGYACDWNPAAFRSAIKQ